jgi:hypothetical protein
MKKAIIFSFIVSFILYVPQTAADTRGMYVDGFENILGNQTKENALLQFAKDCHVDCLTLGGCDLTGSEAAEVNNFIQKAKSSQWGITKIGAWGGTDTFFNTVGPYNDSHVGKFDALTLEHEYWNLDTCPDPRERCFAIHKAFLQAMRNVAQSRGLRVEDYLGWPTQAEAAELVNTGYIDRLLLHYYDINPTVAYNRFKVDRPLSWFAKNPQMEIWPIFSAEPSYMGPWLETDNMDNAETIFMNLYDQEPISGINLNGFQYFNYSELLAVNQPPVATRYAPSNTTVQILPGTTVGFAVNGSDADGNLRGAEWYLDGVHQASYFDMTGSSDTSNWSYTFNGNGTFEVTVIIFDAGFPNLYSNGITWTISTLPTNHPPQLSNPRVTPTSGNTSTTFEFLVDYYDPDGDPPDEDLSRVYIIGNGDVLEEPMTLKNGSPSNGTYHYTTALSQGSYSYQFLFVDSRGLSDILGYFSGPTVYATGQCAIEIGIAVPYVNEDLELEYSLNGISGPWTNIPITAKELDPLVVNIGQAVTFQAGSSNSNYDYEGWDIWDNGNHYGGTANVWPYTTGDDGLYMEVTYSYNPQYYTISGTALKSDGSLVPGGVTLTLTSPEQTLSQITTNGNFSFTGVKGGVPVTVTPTASGSYEFTPSKRVYNNLKQNWTNQTFVASTGDYYVPTVSFTSTPPMINENSTVSFSWTGTDNVTAPANLQYQYKLDGVDANWSVWTSATSKSYDVNNGAYTFWVSAKDEAGNTNQAPISYKFVVNAAPKVISAERIQNSVWASRLTLQMPTSPTHPTQNFVLLPQHSAMSDSELVPVTIHLPDSNVACGANAIVSGQLGITTRITQAGTCWMVTLPQNIPSGQNAQYDIVWGKMKYFGWQEEVAIPKGFPNLTVQTGYTSHVEASYLDDLMRMWRLASKKLSRVNGVFGSEKLWIFTDIADHSGAVVSERIQQYLPGTPYVEPYGCYYTFNGDTIFKSGNSTCVGWVERKYEKVKSGSSTVTNSYYRYVLQFFDVSGNSVNSYNGDWQLDHTINLPEGVLPGGIYATNHDSTSQLWYVLHDTEGRIVRPQTMLESTSSGILYSDHITKIGNNVAFFFSKYHEASLGQNRTDIYYQVRDPSGNLIKATTIVNPPLLPDNVELDDYYEFYNNPLTDSEGKVWVTFRHTRDGQPDEDFYIIIGNNGNIWKSITSVSFDTTFEFCDKDGYIWAHCDNNLLVFDSTGAQVLPTRINTYIPNQVAGTQTVRINGLGTGNSYRLYDRWSPQPVQIDVPSCANRNSMELFDLNLWNNALHTANLNLKKGDTSVWSQSGQFIGHTAFNISGVINEGQNLLVMTQNDFLGGQILITFPYVLSITGDVTGNGIVDFEDLAILVDQWLQPPGIPSADIAPLPNGDNFVDFRDFTALSEHWLQ